MTTVYTARHARNRRRHDGLDHGFPPVSAFHQIFEYLARMDRFQAIANTQFRPRGSECRIFRSACPKWTISFRDEFRTPLGVRKSPKNEPAGGWRAVWGFRVWTTPGGLG